VRGTEVEVPHPSPLRCGADEDRRESEYDDSDISRVDLSLLKIRSENLSRGNKFAHLPQAHVPLRMRSASNPGNVGHEWVKRRFVTRLGASPGDRLFVPAGLDDNPHIERERYVQSLLKLDPLTRARILGGDWEARSMRGVLKREWFEIVDVLPADLRMIRYWDTAYQKKKTADYTVGVKYGIGRNGVAFIVHVARAKASPLRSRASLPTPPARTAARFASFCNRSRAAAARSGSTR
jgi:hypothetical protein